MAQASVKLFDCPYIAYIISLLDDPEDVHRCMLVCKRLNREIAANSHLMKKYPICLEFCFHSVAKHSLEFTLRCSLQVEPGVTSRLQIVFRGNGSVKSCEGMDSWQVYDYHPPMALTHYLDNIDRDFDDRDDFQKLLLHLHTKLDIRNFKLNYYPLPEKLGSYLRSTLRETGIKLERCYVKNVADWDMITVLGCQHLRVKEMPELEINETFYSLDLDRFSLLLASECVTLAPYRRIIEEWSQGIREVRNLQIIGLRHIRSPPFTEDDILAMLGGLDMVQKQTAEQDVMVCELKRSFDVAILVVKTEYRPSTKNVFSLTIGHSITDQLKNWHEQVI